MNKLIMAVLILISTTAIAQSPYSDRTDEQNKMQNPSQTDQQQEDRQRRTSRNTYDQNTDIQSRNKSQGQKQKQRTTTPDDNGGIEGKSNDTTR